MSQAFQQQSTPPEMPEPPALAQDRWRDRTGPDRYAEGQLRDRKLVARIRMGDPSAFSDLYRQYRENVHRFILKRIRDKTEAEDLTQETFVEAYRSVASFEGRSSLLSWLLGIARHICHRFYRFTSRWMVGAQGSDFSHEPAIESREESRVDALRVLQRCDEVLAHSRGVDNQSIFHLRYRDARSIRAIATSVGKSEHAVKASLRRSRLVLQRSVKDLPSVAEAIP